MLPNTSAALDYHRQSGRAYGGIMPPPFGGTNGYQPYQVKGGPGYSSPNLPVNSKFLYQNLGIKEPHAKNFPAKGGKWCDGQ